MSIMAMTLAPLLIGLGIASMLISGVETARADMSRYEQIALARTADRLSAVVATSGTQGVTSAQAKNIFASALKNVTPSSWNYSVEQVQVYDSSQAGALLPDGKTVPGAGIFAEVGLKWQTPVSGLNPTIQCPEFMKANIFVQPTGDWKAG